MNDIAGIDRTAVHGWLNDHIDGLDDGPDALTYDLITGGHSNLTYTVTATDGRRWVLRRPPLGNVLASAHDMSREHRLIEALQDSGVPVPKLIGLCTDETVNDAPFYVMEFVEGGVLRNQSTAAEFLTPEQRYATSRDLIEVLARLHAITPASVGLDTLAKTEDYVGRQLRRWSGQFEKSKLRDIPLIGEVHDRLADAIPPQGDAGIVHGDYRLDNCMIGADAKVAAVLDWELCTLGDVRADVGLLMVYWVQAGDSTQPLDDAPTLAPGFATRDELLGWYADATGRDMAEIDYFTAFSYWRLACILEGVYSRYKANVMGSEHPDLDAMGDRVIDLAQLAAERLESHR
ncbi:MAG: phosphotransferase family protein [Acidimicrobiales bacterium]|nr:phosphotransferase family protein [Acidimicrobiales bacterium]